MTYVRSETPPPPLHDVCFGKAHGRGNVAREGSLGEVMQMIIMGGENEEKTMEAFFLRN